MEDSKIDNTQTSNADQQTNAPVVPAQESAEDVQDRNWKQFREERKKEREQLAAEKKISAQKAREAEELRLALEALASKPSPQPQYQAHDPVDETEDQRIDRLVEQKLEKREAARKAEEAQKEAVQLPVKLKQAYSDFDTVCHADNLDYLEFHYPEIANAYKYMPDGFEKWANIYKAVKKFVPNTDSKKDMQRAEKNMQKPQSASASGVSHASIPPAPTNITEQRRAENWARMQKVLKGLS